MSKPSRKAPRKQAPAGSAKIPERIHPMLAQAAEEPFDSSEHLFEIKWDGTRCIAILRQDRLSLQNRRFIEMRQRYPELACLLDLPPDTVLDGEIVVLEAGKPSFRKLQQREHLLDPQRIDMLRQRLPATFMVFDLLYCQGKNLMPLPLTERRARLGDVIADLESPHVLVPDHIVEHGRTYFSEVQKLGLEGIMAKRLDSPYLPGKRSPHWLKMKVARVEDFDIIGYVQREGEEFISSLIIGMVYRRKWIYKGKVGSGFTECQRQQLFCELRDAPVLEQIPAEGPKGAVWRQPGWRCTVRYFEKTYSGKLRAPVFKKLIKDNS